MRNWLRRIRGVLGSGVLWGGLWAAAGACLGVFFGFGGFGHGLDWQVVARTATELGAIGGVAGISFGTLLSSTQGRRSLKDVSLLGVAVAGLIGGFLAPGVFAVLGLVRVPTAIALGKVCSVLGAITSTAAVGVAKRAEGNPALGRSETLLLPEEVDGGEPNA